MNIATTNSISRTKDLASMRKLFFTMGFYFALITPFYSQNFWGTPSYGLHDLIVYSGSGASTRHVEKNYFSGKYDSYLKTPFIAAGFDYCFSSTGGGYSLWGVGLYFSGGLGKKEYTKSNSEVGKLWSSYLCAVKFSHHNWFSVREKFDVCSGYILGTRTTNYEQVYINDERAGSTSKRSYELAAGISCTFRYHPTEQFAIYAEGALGYNIDVFQIGIARRIKDIGR